PSWGVTSGGQITTIAGNGTGGYAGDGLTAGNAVLNQPIAVALDAAGNIYVADVANERIRKINALTGIVTTIAGTGVGGFSADGGLAINAQLANPTGVAVDALGNVYIAEQAGNKVRKVTA